jgi:thermostable 8-oxoguanine DNA glycosylase
MDTLINPRTITNFERTKEQKELFALFCLVVAGKNSDIQARKLDELLEGTDRPFWKIRDMIARGTLRENLERVKMGQYNRLTKAFANLVAYHNAIRLYSYPSNLGIEQLEGVMGFKSSRFFLVHSYKHLQMAILDTHILKWLKEQGHDVPAATPSSKKKYIAVEQLFLDEARNRGKTIAELDLEVWKSRQHQVA